MAWQDDMVAVLRVLINDLDETNYTYSDERLETVLITSAMQVKGESSFLQTYTVNIANETISPDPTLSDTLDDAFTNLVTLKAACIIERGSVAQSASQAIAVKDGTSSIDLRGVAQGKLELLKQGWCAVYEDAKWEHQRGGSGQGVAGEAVLTPFRVYAWGNFGYGFGNHAR